MDRWTLNEGESYKWLCSLPDASADALITDPPYSSGGQYRGDRAARTGAKYAQSGVSPHADFDGDGRDQRSYLAWCALWLSESCRVLRPGGVFAVFTDWRQLPTTTDAVQAGGFIWRGIMTWDKTEAARGQQARPTQQGEYVVWGSRGPLPSGRDAPSMPGVVRHAQQRDRHHQTGKPTEVMRQIVRICERGGLILDPFAGSGTTGVAALLEGYRFAGSEFSPHYAAVARQRLADAERGYVRPFGEGEAQVRLVDALVSP